jgi:predicted dienelactone hydrolase
MSRNSTKADRWGTAGATALAVLAFALLPQRQALAVEVPPLPLPGPYAVECSNLAQDFSRIAPGEDAPSYWEGVPRADGSQRRPADLLADPANTPMVTVNVPDNHDVFGSSAGRTLSYVIVICHPTSSSNPRLDYPLPTGRSVPHMMQDGDAPLWPDATTRFPVLLFSHGYGGSPISTDYIQAVSVMASFGYVVAAPFHTDATFLNVEDLQTVADAVFLATHLEQFNALQALRPLALSATLDLVLGQPRWRDRVDATQVGAFGASMGAEAILLMAGARMTTTFAQSSTPIMFDARLKAAVGYVPYFGQVIFPAFGPFEHGLDDVTLSYLAIGGTADTTAPLVVTLEGIERLAGPRELVAITGVKHQFDVPSTADIFTWTVTYLDAEVRRDPAARAKLLSMTSVAGGGDDHVLVPFNGPAVVTPPPLNFEGTWWNAPAGSESGWGINFAHQGDVIFATWFTHDANGRAWYLTMTALRIAPNTFAGTLYRTTGPPLDAIPFAPAQVQRIAVGTGTLTFADGNNGTFAYTVNGIPQTKTITRFVFGALPTCTWGILANLALATNYQDVWWAAGGAESGWGVNFAHQGDVIFATLFTYDFAGAALPLSAALMKVGPGIYSGSLIKTSGPAFSAMPFDPNAVTRTVVGTATVAFTSGNAAILSFQVSDAGKTTMQTKSIERLVFRPPGTVCQ